MQESRQKSERVRVLPGAVIAILLGICSYLLLNQKTEISSWMLRYFHVTQIDSDSFFLELLRNFGADFCWAFSLVLFVQFVLDLRGKQKMLLLLCSGLGVAYEIAQGLGWVLGTADFWDVLVYVLGSATATIYVVFQEEKKNEEEI